MRKHDKVLDDLVCRLLKKPGFIFIEAPYVATTLEGKKVCGELDVFLIKNVNGKEYKRYYEVKSRNSATAWRKAMEQFKRHHYSHMKEDWKYIYVTPEKVERIRIY